MGYYISATALGVMYDNTWFEKHKMLHIDIRLFQPLLSELMGKIFSLRFQKLDSEVDGWFWYPYST